MNKNQLQKEILKSLPSKPSGRLLLAPRIGKTKIAIDTIKREKPKSILWVTPSSKLAKEDIPKEFETWKAKRYLKYLVTSTWASLHKVKGFFDLIILDEEQYATEKNLSNILDKTLGYNHLITMTGTPTNNVDKLNLYRRLGLKILYSLDINKAVKANVLSDYEINVMVLPFMKGDVIERKYGNNKFYVSEEKHYKYLTTKIDASHGKNKMFNSINRLNFLATCNTKTVATQVLLRELKGKNLVFAHNIKQSNTLSNNTFNSKTDDKHLENFCENRSTELVLVNSGGVGFTYKSIDNLIIVQCDSDNNGLVAQKISRTLLSQDNYKAKIWLMCIEGTQDVTWVNSVLSRFDKNKVNFVKVKL
jgi:superfamily II DNA or RNA helicase